MSEQNKDIEKNYPGAAGAAAATDNSEGATGSGGVGSFTARDADSNVSPATSLGQSATALFGVTSGPNAVNPTGTNSGILAPEQAKRFIDYVWDGTVLAKDGRKVTMRANTMEIEKVNVGERVIRAAAQGNNNYTNAGATFTKVELTTKKIRLDWEVTTESLEDNIEGGALEDHLVRLMTNAFANDLEDLAINGDGSTGDFLSIMTGFVKQVQTADSHEAVTVISNDQWTTTAMQDIILAMPRKYRALKNNLKFYAGSDVFQSIVKNNGTLADAISAAFSDRTGSTQANRQSYLDGNAQTFGGARTTRVLGVDVMEVPYYPADYVDLTFPQNRVWGFQRDITVNRQYKPKKDTIEYTVFVRFGIQWEELDAVAYHDISDS
jgi:HK97 family phage major capsid protein